MNKEMMIVPETSTNTCGYEVIYVNGKRIQIKKGATVMVDPIVKEIYNETTEKANRANRQKQPLALEA